MKSFSLSLIALISTLITSCKNEDADADTTETNQTQVPVTTTNMAATDTTKKATTATVATTTTAATATTVANTPVTTTAPVTTAAIGLNPKHGQPGHRCDIPEGAPLNSKPSQPTVAPPVQTTTTAPQTINLNPPNATIKPAQTTTVTAPGMNPEHGKPGHRCDIAVGAPLNSKPNPAVTQPPPVSTTIPPPTPPIKQD